MTVAMNHNDQPPPMQSYPSPTAVAQDSGGPFYTSANPSQNRLSSPEALQMAAHLSRGIASSVSSALHDHQEQPPPTHQNHQFEPEHHLHAPIHQSPLEHHHTSYPAAVGATDESTSTPRKRTKVSRACDECRRKKIRCDATTDSGDEQCTSCRKADTRCQFSRVPMKRGPSKGYIKELADRLNLLEGAVQAGEIPQYASMHHEDASPRAQDEFSPPPNSAGATRKRAYSNLSNDLTSTYPSRPAGWAQEMARHLPNAASSSQGQNDSPSARYTSYYSPNGMAPQPVWKNSPEEIRRPNFDEALSITTQNTEHGPGWDDAIIEGYYNIIHPTFPILATKSKLSSSLSSCSLILREAFFEALYAAVRSYPSLSSAQPHDPPNPIRALELLTRSHFENPATRTLASNIIHLQIMILMAIEADSRGTTALTDSGPPRSVWLGSAVGLAYHLKLHTVKNSDNLLDGDADSDEKLARRLWWSLVVLDRWHASSTASPMMIPETSVVLLPEDQIILGTELYHFTRLTSILGHLATIVTAPADLMSPTSSSGSIIGTLLIGELERFRESFPSTLSLTSSPLVHLCYWHIKVLMKRLAPSTAPLDLIGPAVQLATILTSNPTLVTPLNHHFSALAALTLIDLADQESTREEAERAIQLLANSQGAPSNWDVETRELIRKKLVSIQTPITSSSTVASGPTANKKSLRDSQGLKHLADLATATEGSQTEPSLEGRTERKGSDSQNTTSTTPTASAVPASSGESAPPTTSSQANLIQSQSSAHGSFGASGTNVASQASANTTAISHAPMTTTSSSPPESWDPSWLNKRGYLNLISGDSTA